MSIRQRDYLLRMIEQIAATIARITRLKHDGELDAALAEIHAATGELLGARAALLGQVDVATAAQLVNDPSRLGAWARLLAEEADILRLRGTAGSDALARRALGLAREAAARERDGAPSDLLALIERLREPTAGSGTPTSA
jgi:hypothetical protein